MDKNKMNAGLRTEDSGLRRLPLPSMTASAMILWLCGQTHKRHRLAGWLPGWLPGWLFRWLLVGWLACWQPGCLAA